MLPNKCAKKVVEELNKSLYFRCFAPFGRRASVARAKQQERINVAKQMCDGSC